MKAEVSKITEYVKKGNVKHAMELLFELIHSDDFSLLQEVDREEFEDELVLLNNRLNRIEKEKFNDTIDSDRYDRELNKIILNIFRFLKGIEAVDTIQVLVLIDKFYSSLNNRQFDDAWDCLSSHIKQGWKNGFEDFEKGYVNFVAIDNLRVFSVIEKSKDTYECLVYYIDNVALSKIPPIAKLKEFRLKEKDSIIAALEEIETELKEIGAEGIEDIELHRLFEDSISEYIWYVYNIKPDIMKKKFKHTFRKKVPRLFEMYCILDEGHLKIDRIVDVKLSAIR
ncbi:MAG: hypothetical protein AAFN93_09705 [Bacteroidota bacterium]